MIDDHADGAYAALFFDVACPQATKQIDLHYDLFFAVDPSHRGQGLVRQLLALSDDWMIKQGIPFGILLGKKEVYGSSGYRHADNPVRYLVPSTGEWLEQSFSYFLIKSLGAIDWPTGGIDLRGPKF